MKPAFKAAAITILVSQIIVILIIAGSGWKDSKILFGLFNIILAFLGLVPGAICLLKRKRNTGFGIVIGCGIMLVMGYGTCVVGPGIDVH